MAAMIVFTPKCPSEGDISVWNALCDSREQRQKNKNKMAAACNINDNLVTLYNTGAQICIK